MTGAGVDGQAAAADDRYRALLAVSEAIVSHRDLAALFHELAGRLHQVGRFDDTLDLQAFERHVSPKVRQHLDGAALPARSTPAPGQDQQAISRAGPPE